jgi:hypothetical protein
VRSWSRLCLLPGWSVARRCLARAIAAGVAVCVLAASPAASALAAGVHVRFISWVVDWNDSGHRVRPGGVYRHCPGVSVFPPSIGVYATVTGSGHAKVVWTFRGRRYARRYDLYTDYWAWWFSVDGDGTYRLSVVQRGHVLAKTSVTVKTKAC